jgi:hypothetical protein
MANSLKSEMKGGSCAQGAELVLGICLFRGNLSRLGQQGYHSASASRLCLFSAKAAGFSEGNHEYSRSSQQS